MGSSTGSGRMLAPLSKTHPSHICCPPTTSIRDTVRAYYASFSEREWQSLTNPDDGAVEFALTKQLLATYLPPSGRILDLGGGPGRYTIWLAERGYQIV